MSCRFVASCRVLLLLLLLGFFAAVGLHGVGGLTAFFFAWLLYVGGKRHTCLQVPTYVGRAVLIPWGGAAGEGEVRGHPMWPGAWCVVAFYAMFSTPLFLISSCFLIIITSHFGWKAGKA